MADLSLKNATSDAARAAMLDCLTPLPTITVSLDQALGQTLRQDIVAARDQPPFAASAMDGYAVRSADTPATLDLIGQSAAGAGFVGTLGHGQCVRIFTGAPIPEGGDSVVIQEDVTVSSNQVTVPHTRLGQHVRERGVDFRQGDMLLKQGQPLDPIGLALIAATGASHVRIARRPIIVLMSGGDEIVSPGEKPGPFDVFDSISTGLSALVQSWGGQAIVLLPRRDSIEALQEGFGEAFAQAELVVTVGGASVGDRDLMKPALAAFDPIFRVDKIALRPGKPAWYATTKAAPVLGLPGNPASALVCAYLFLRPCMAVLANQSSPAFPAFKYAKLSRTLPANGPREHYLRAVIHVDDTGQNWISPCEDQDSSLLSVFQTANALVRLPPNQASLGVGDVVEFMSLNRDTQINSKPLNHIHEKSCS
jgi:molybdopterin molybdotransferase